MNGDDFLGAFIRQAVIDFTERADTGGRCLGDFFAINNAAIKIRSSDIDIIQEGFRTEIDITRYDEYPVLVHQGNRQITGAVADNANIHW